ncbi:hypothetical protein CMV_020172 [Castanea mollissima]|uniref:Uncharacterized protein n=1 Tax=Castanea mollissima TaxID=60419 RepID=A0A8J4QLW9_9ROSI|nr:hypothetical protein CMV_020172 [Castanea mollissima]
MSKWSSHSLPKESEEDKASQNIIYGDLGGWRKYVQQALGDASVDFELPKEIKDEVPNIVHCGLVYFILSSSLGLRESAYSGCCFLVPT